MKKRLIRIPFALKTPRTTAKLIVRNIELLDFTVKKKKKEKTACTFRAPSLRKHCGKPVPGSLPLSKCQFITVDIFLFIKRTKKRKLRHFAYEMSGFGRERFDFSAVTRTKSEKCPSAPNKEHSHLISRN